MSRLIMSLNKCIKGKKITKKTTIGWKTFNSKKIKKFVLKIKRIVKRLNNTIRKVVINKQQQIIKMVITILQKDKITTNINTNINVAKSNLYNSFYVNQKKNDKILNETNVQIQGDTTGIHALYSKYLFMNNILNSINKTRVRDLKLPPQRTTYTVLRSPHADKKAREQFAKEAYTIKIIVNQYVSFMKYFNKVVHLYTKPFISSYKYNKIY